MRYLCCGLPLLVVWYCGLVLSTRTVRGLIRLYGKKVSRWSGVGPSMLIYNQGTVDYDELGVHIQFQINQPVNGS
jgi:hypothetical protein